MASGFPDLVDKPLAWYLGVLPSGRSLAHSAFVIVALAIGIALLGRRSGRGEYGVAFAVGGLSHSVLDILSLLWDPATSAASLFWPLFSVPIPSVLAAYQSTLWTAYFLSEAVFAVLAVVLWSRDGAPGLALVRAILERDRRPSG